MEIELLKKVIQTGKSNKSMAKELGISPTNMMHWIKKYGLLEVYAKSKKDKDPRLAKEKKCPNCAVVKEIKDFSKKKDGRPLSWCKVCTNAKRAKSARDKRREERGLNSEDVLCRSKMSDEEKKQISERMLKWWADNPGRKPWVNPENKAFKSPPCDRMRQFLKENGIEFVPEYGSLVPGRHFSADIAMPDKNLIIEVNGNQHYLPDRTLRPYYQERHDLITKQGWTVYEIYYKSCYDEKFLQELLSAIKSSVMIKEFDYNAYLVANPLVKKSEKPKPRCSCGSEMSFKSKTCIKCSSRENIAKNRKINPKWGKRPPKEDLGRMVLEMPMTKIAERYNISDNGVRKWCKFYGIEIGKRLGYWTKRQAGMTHEEALIPKVKKIKRPVPPKLTKEWAEILVSDLLSGLTMKELTKKHKLSSRNLHERCAKLGVALPKPKRKTKSASDLSGQSL